MRHPATRPAVGDRLIGYWGERRVAWVTEGLTHTIVGLVDDSGVISTVFYHDWLRLVHEADTIFTDDEEV